ncbi:MAG: hypothetical protein H3C43_11880 [Leptonema sp. (in: Bacteria)]|nr:hypothetical protein [Leptonema sp. (in: bacteria)]
MNRKQLILIGTITGLILFIGIIFFLLREDQSPNREQTDQEAQNTPLRLPSGEGFWPDAPAPDVDPEEIRKLWPDVFEPKPDRAQVEKEWTEFAKVHPNNMYIPSQFLPEPSDSEKKRRQEVLDTVGEVETNLAVQRTRLNKEAQIGVDGPSNSEPQVTPKQQRSYFEYRISELESRIQLIEYFLDKGSASADQKATANQDLAQWKKELEDYKKVMAEIPE